MVVNADIVIVIVVVASTGERIQRELRLCQCRFVLASPVQSRPQDEEEKRR